MNDAQAPGRNRISKTIAVAAAVAATALLAAPAAQAVTRYAAPAGAGTGNCLTAETACTLERAVGGGFFDTTEVVVTPGTYDLGSSSLGVGPGIDVHGQAGAPRPLITSAATPNATIMLNSDGARLADVRVEKTGGASGGAINVFGNGVVVERVYALSSVANSFTCVPGRGLIRDTVCASTGSGGRAVGHSQAGTSFVSTATLRNVTAVATGTGSVGVGIDASAPGVQLTLDAKNVIADGTAADVRTSIQSGGAAASVLLANSNYATADTAGGGTITPAGANGNQTAAPQFVSAATGDFHQGAASPTVNGGATSGDLGASDLDGQARSFGAAPDIGADEFIANDARWAEPAGDGPEPCLQADPCALEPAIEGNAKDGDTITVLPGDYSITGSRTLDLDVDAVLRGAPGQARPRISFGGGVFYGLRANGSGSDPQGAIVRDLELRQTGGYWPLSLREATAERILAGGGGIGPCGTFQNSLLRDSVCIANGGDGAVAIDAGVGGDPIVAKLRNVTAIATGPVTNAISVYADDGAAIIDGKNVIAQAAVAADIGADSTADGSSQINLDYSNFATRETASNGAATDPGTAHNQTAEPQLVNVAGGDLRQQGGSPTVDAGVADPDLGSTDNEGQDRAVGDVPDIGADEWFVAPPAPAAVNPASPANDNQPEVSGSAPAGSTVRLFGDAACAGAVLASGTAAAFAAPGLTATVADNSTTAFRARAVDSFGHPSDCSSESVSYAELTPGAARPSVAPVAKPKCAKARKSTKGKGKRKRCKRPKRG